MSQSTVTCMTGGQAVVGTLANQGVERIFGVPGGHSIPLFDALHRQTDVQLVLGRHEQGLVGMADGYNRASGRIGVVTTTSGPGVANMAAAMGSATTDTVSVLAISSTVASDLVGKNRGGLHDLNESLEIMRPVCGVGRSLHTLGGTKSARGSLWRTLAMSATDVVIFVGCVKENVAVHLQNVIPDAGVEAVQRGEKLLSAGGMGFLRFRAEPPYICVADNLRDRSERTRPYPRRRLPKGGAWRRGALADSALHTGGETGPRKCPRQPPFRRTP